MVGKLLETGTEGGVVSGPENIEHLPRHPPLRLMLFPHHGSETPHLARLLEGWAPEEIWISAALPPAVGRELSRRGLPWDWTGSGALALRVLGDPP